MYEIVAVEDRTITIRDGSRRFKMSRYCPHEAGDLSLGYIEGHTLHCPMHCLAIDLRTGEQPCQTLPNPEIVPLPNE